MSFVKILKKVLGNSRTAKYYWTKLYWKRTYGNMKMSDVDFAKQSYQRLTGMTLNLDNPVTFNDKLWYLKLSNRDPLLTKCTDKYLVREYVKECGLEHILNELYGVYDNAKDINFNALPHTAFLKCNQASGINVIWNKDKPFSKRYFIRKFNFHLNQNYYVLSREWNYKHIVPKIICERVLRDKEGRLPKDYKFMCFHGEPKLLIYSENVCLETGAHNNSPQRFTNVYDMNFNLLPMKIKFRTDWDAKVAKPENFEEMKEYARILSKPFPCVRVDLYNVDGKIYFGELTFYHGGASHTIEPYEWAVKVGSWLDVSGYHIAPDAYEKGKKV